MSTITLPNIRVSSDLTVKLKLKDGGVAIDWSTLQNIKVSIYSDAQRALAGRCGASIDAEDPTLLVCTYAANKPQYVGVNRVVVSAKYMGETKTYDKPAFNFVRWTDDQAGEQITIEDPDIDVEITVEDVSSSILQEAVDAAFEAADRANDAAAAAEHMVDIHTGPEGKSAYEVAVEEGYVGTEEEWLASLVGPQGAQGIQGETGEAAGFGTVSVSLQEDGGQPSATVAASGTDTAKNFDFTFNNLKGEKGDKGDQGNSGYTGAAGELEVVNNLTDGGAAKALSAEMGKTLEGEVRQLEADLREDIDLEIDGVAILDKGVVWSDGYVSGTTGVITLSSTSQFSQPILLRAGEKLSYKTGAQYGKAVVQVPDSSPVQIGDRLLGETIINYQTADVVVNYTATEDIYIVITVQKASFDIAFTAYADNSINERIDSLDARADGIENDVEALNYEAGLGNTVEKDISWSNGYANNAGEIVSSTGSYFSQPILLKKNETIKYKTSDTYKNAVVRVANNNEVAVGDTLSMVDRLIDYANANVERSYTATEDIYIVISVRKGYFFVSFIEHVPDSLDERISIIEGNEKRITPDWSLGYVSNNEIIESSGTSVFCQPIKLLAGQTIKLGTPRSWSQAIVAVESGDPVAIGDTLVPIASIKKYGEIYNYAYYTAETDCYIICSGYYLEAQVWIINAGANKKIEELNEKVSSLDARVLDIETEINGVYGNYTQLIGFKRAMQQVLLKWTPKNPVPKRNGTSFQANVEVTGLVYSETMETDKRVGWDVSLLTFMTAVNNPYSLLYTENISATRSQSAYGITYHGDGNSGAYYGSVCNTFAMLGVCNDVSYTTPQVWEERTDLFFKVYDQSIRGLELMDLVGRNGHVILVTGLVKDKYGVNVGVQLSEEAGTVAITRPVMNETQFASFLLANGYSVMRFKEQYKNIIYTPSPFVAVLDEVPEEYTYNNDICTIYGDYASILEGDLLHINYTKGSYTQMKIYKDDNLVETIQLSSDASVHDIDLAEYGFTYGKYKACLSDGSNDSAFTHWELIRIEMSLSGDELTFSVNGGKALYWDWQKQNGGSYIPHIFDQTQASGGSVNVAESGKGDYNYCIKVHAQGDYGRVAKRIIV